MIFLAISKNIRHTFFPHAAIFLEILTLEKLDYTFLELSDSWTFDMHDFQVGIELQKSDTEM